MSVAAVNAFSRFQSAAVSWTTFSLSPMAGLSAEHVPQLVELIRAVHTDERKTVLMVEHHIDVVTGLAQRIAVMHHGALLACDTPAAVMANPTVQSAYLGEDL